ncbi:MAG: cell division protein FtsQ/DivIB [Sandaracinaceae bacterium]
MARASRTSVPPTKPSRRAKRKPPAPESAPRRNRRTRPKKAEPVEPEAPKPSVKERAQAGAGAVRALGAKLRRPAELFLRGVVVVAVGIGAVALGRLVERHVRSSEAFAVTEIQLEGHVRLTQAEVLGAAGLAEGQNVFDVAPEEAAQALEQHPWIAEANVTRRLPGTYSVEVRERRAVALLALGDVFLVGEDGAVFKRVEEDDPLDLPVITGVDRRRFTRDRGFRTSVLLEVVALLHDYRGAGLWQREPIGEIHVESDDGLSLYTGDDATFVRLGHGPFRAKLRRLRTVLDELGERGARAAYVYLDNERRPDRVTVRLREEDEIPEEPAPEPASDTEA